MAHSRAKGARGELEAALLLMQLGLQARRSVQYNGLAGGADIALDASVPLHVEVKRTERLRPYEFIEQAQRDCKKPNVPIVLMRSSHKPWLVMMTAADWVRVSEVLIAARVQGACHIPEAL